MNIGGWQKLTLKDYPGKVASIIFTNGCCFRCGFCHNPEIVLPPFEHSIDEDEVMAFLKKRRKVLEGVVITGGEPTIHSDLFAFMKKIKNLGYAIKLDTCGIMPEKLEEFIAAGVVDYIAMDIKAPLEKYEKIACVKVEIKKIKKSIGIILKGAVDYEFRTTIVKELHEKEDIYEMARLIKGAKRYYLQKFRPAPKLIDIKFKNYNSYSYEAFKDIANKCMGFVKICEVR